CRHRSGRRLRRSGRRVAAPSRQLRDRLPRRRRRARAGTDDAGGATRLRVAVRAGHRTHRAADPSRQRAVAAARRALRLPARGAGATVDLAARPPRRRDPLVVAAGRPPVTLHSLRDRALYVTPIRIGLGVLWLAAARIAGAPATGATLAFA